MKKIKKITLSLLMLTSILTLALKSENTEAMGTAPYWTKAGNFDGPYDEICQERGNTCTPDVIVPTPAD
ncbi:MAG: hypothetical protein L0J49_05750 [Lactococcus lactis]|nr:hypothetical protein [Lactococcus lactis]